MMNKIDDKSKEFIKYALSHFDDEETLGSLVENSIYELEMFFGWNPIKHLKRLAKQKMIKGAMEHGSPDPKRDYTKELQDEYLDLVLWGLMKKWVEGK